ncbi:MAG: hypothetical protein C4526_06625 [Nitrospiraceae bacterium]|nr:MAG: hypothetical protein C4526_06625 [Nitrospiraceae bacterium]
MKNRFIVLTVITAMAFLGYLSFTVVSPKSQAVNAAKKTYTGTAYVSGMGGHFAKADITIDPNDTENPVKVKNLDRVVIGDKTTHPTHDPRIDTEDKNVMFWSTYKLDPGKKVHVGKSDLKTGNVIKDIALDVDARVKSAAPLYCGSGQTKNSFMPIMMATESYVDVFDKKDFTHKHRVFFDELGYKAGGYKFFHGTNTPDMKGFVITVNLAENGKGTGKIDVLMLDLKELENGKVKVLAKNTLTGEPDKTITFRQFFTKDGKYLLQSGGDRFFLVDAKTLKLIDEEMITGGENHDAMPTPDGKYAMLTLRQPVTVKIEEGTKTVTDGTLQIYDIDAKKLVGKPVSVCNTCHGDMGIKESAILCGLDGNLQ